MGVYLCMGVIRTFIAACVTNLNVKDALCLSFSGSGTGN